MNGIIPTKLELPKNTDFFYGFVQMGETFGSAMVPGLTWKDGKRWLFAPAAEPTIYQVDRSVLSLAFSFNYFVTEKTEEELTTEEE